MVKTVETAGNGWNQLKMAKNGQKLLKTVENGWKWLKTVEYSWNQFKTVKSVKTAENAKKKWLKTNKNRLKMVVNG